MALFEVDGKLLLCAAVLLQLISHSAVGVAVTKFSRPYLLTYVTDSTDYINAVFADVSIWTLCYFHLASVPLLVCTVI